MTTNQPGVCPKCGSEAIEYDAMEIEDDGMMFYPFFCHDCDFAGREWHVTKFDTMTDLEGRMPYHPNFGSEAPYDLPASPFPPQA